MQPKSNIVSQTERGRRREGGQTDKKRRQRNRDRQAETRHIHRETEKQAQTDRQAQGQKLITLMHTLFSTVYIHL